MSDKSKDKSDTKRVTARIDPKLKFILTIIATIDNVSIGEILERAFWGNGIEREQGTGIHNRVEEFKQIVEYIQNQKENISTLIDRKLYEIIDEGAKQQNISKVTIIETALWDYVEKEGFERSPVTGDYIKITVELPGRFKDYRHKS